MFILASWLLSAQQAGKWNNYLSYSNATKVIASESKVFCVTDGGIFYYDLEDQSINKLDDVVTLSDFGVKTIAYSTENKVLVVAYKNSNIDLVYSNGKVVNLSDIKRKTLSADKSINNIAFAGSEAYLACGFGVVVINLAKEEIKDTYFIGDQGLPIVVNDIEIHNQEIYAATNEGIFRAPTSGVNLLDYANWIKIDNIPHSDDKFSQLEEHGGKLIANYTPDEWALDELYVLNDGDWSPYLTSIRYANDMQSAGGYLVVAGRNAVYVIDNNHNLIGTIRAYDFGEEQISEISPSSGIVTSDGSVWVSDYKNVMVRIKNEDFERIATDGPINNDIFSLTVFNSQLWAAPGDLSGYKTPYFQGYQNGRWEHFANKTNPELRGFHNILEIAVDPFDENHFFVASWGGGLLEYRNNEFVTRYYNKNSPLETALPEQPDEPFTRVGGLGFDDEGNLWMNNAECVHNLHRLSPDGKWQSFVLPELANKDNPTRLIVTQNGDKWMLVRNHDAYVVGKTGEQKKQLLVTTYFSNGTNEYFTRMSDVYSIAEDKDGAIWIGTSLGVAVYNNPSRIWSTDNFYASQPGLDLKDGIYHPLLSTETVTAIAVDGANRKWLGTKNSGVYLVSESGEEEILHFTAENSPLLSNSITALAINDKSGEVFIGTDKGLISYQSDANEGNNTYSNVYVYPNPVRETYDGPVTITGLIADTDIKITDISGNLVYKTTSLGGQASWDGRNLNGNRVKTGVYLVLCNDKQGNETHITKLLFIH